MFRSITHVLWKPLLVALIWSACAMLSLAFTRNDGGLAAVWPANAILTAVLLIEKGPIRLAYVAAVTIASLLLKIGFPVMLMIGIPIASVGEAVFAAWLIARLAPTGQMFEAPANIFRFGLAVALACIPSSLAIGLLFTAAKGAPWWHPALNWMASHACGLMIVTPLLLILHRDGLAGRIRSISSDQLFRCAAMLGLVGAVSTLVFQQSSYSISFLVVPALLVATFHLRASGAAASVVIIASIGSFCMIRGSGPLSTMPISAIERGYVLQLFTAVMFLCALPLAALLDERDRLAADAMRHLGSLRTIAERIDELLFRVEENGRWAYLGASYQTITGRSIATALGKRGLLELSSKENRSAVARQFLSLRSGELNDIDFTATIVDAIGIPRDIEVSMFRSVDSCGRAILGGIARDVTARKLLDAQLRESERRAQRAAEKSELAAHTDELTGLPNRRAFFERLDARIEQDGVITLALFDVDHFKRINDSYGHPAGDEVLRGIAAEASAKLRDSDMLARVGGEEFAMLLDNVDSDASIATAERIIATIAGASFALPARLVGAVSDIQVHVTVSMGLARHREGQNAAGLVAEADRALYAAKHGGRNQLQLAA